MADLEGKLKPGRATSWVEEISQTVEGARKMCGCVACMQHTDPVNSTGAANTPRPKRPTSCVANTLLEAALKR